MAPLTGSTDWSPSFDDMSFGRRVDIFPSFFHLSSLLSWRYAPSSPSSPPYPYKVKECRTICGQGGGGKENEAKSDEGALYSAGERGGRDGMTVQRRRGRQELIDSARLLERGEGEGELTATR